VRQDLIEVLNKLAKRIKSGKLHLDAIVIETTGMADPAPVAQTFFVDDAVKEFARLDGIVTLVDAKHIEQHLDEEKPEGAENEAVEQVTRPQPHPHPLPHPSPHTAVREKHDGADAASYRAIPRRTEPYRAIIPR
jgi:hypothetical protein